MNGISKIQLLSYMVVIAMLSISCGKDHFTEFINPSVVHTDFISAGDTSSGIYYHDIIPDWEKHGFGLFNDSINIDINNDSIVDISLKYTTVLSGSEYDQVTTVSCFNGADISPDPKSIADTIGSYSGWGSSTSILCFTKINFVTQDTTYSGMWNGVDNKYLGVRVTKNRHVLYGWVRMSVLVPPTIIYIQQIIVKDFACRKLD